MWVDKGTEHHDTQNDKARKKRRKFETTREMKTKANMNKMRKNPIIPYLQKTDSMHC